MNYIKKILYIFSIYIFFPTLTFAQTCPEVNLKPDVKIDISNLQINQQLSVGQLARLPSTHHEATAFPIGLYIGEKSFHVEPYYKSYSNGHEVCAVLSNFKLVIQLNPVIYISQEAQKFSCTYNRVYEHEMKHYKIDLMALQKLSQHLPNKLTSLYSKPVWGSSKQSVQQQINQTAQELNQYVAQFLEVETDPYNQQLDTMDNYRKEAQICSNPENVALLQLIKRN